MEESKLVPKGEYPSLNPLILSRQTITKIMGIAILLWAFSFFLWGQGELDKWLLISQNGLRTNELVINIAQVTSKYGMSLIVMVYLLYLPFAFKNEELREVYRIYPLVLLMFGIAGIGGDLLKEIFDRSRPFVTYAGDLITFSSATTPSFPSGHATKSMALALPFLLFLAPKNIWHKGVKILLAFFVLSVCYARVLLGAHYVSDVLAGAAMALISIPLVLFLTNKILSKMTQELLNKRFAVWVVTLLGLMVLLMMF